MILWDDDNNRVSLNTSQGIVSITIPHKPGGKYGYTTLAELRNPEIIFWDGGMYITGYDRLEVDRFGNQVENTYVSKSFSLTTHKKRKDK